MRPVFPLALATTLVAFIVSISYVSAEPGWSVERSEVAYLFYGEPGKPVLTITCRQEEGETGKDETRIEVETEKGTRTKADKVVLVIEAKAGRKEVPLKADICGRDNECTNLPDGEIYRYEASLPGKRARSRHRRQGRDGQHRCAWRQVLRSARRQGVQKILRHVPQLVMEG